MATGARSGPPDPDAGALRCPYEFDTCAGGGGGGAGSAMGSCIDWISDDRLAMDMKPSVDVRWLIWRCTRSSAVSEARFRFGAAAASAAAPAVSARCASSEALQALQQTFALSFGAFSGLHGWLHGPSHLMQTSGVPAVHVRNVLQSLMTLDDGVAHDT